MEKYGFFSILIAWLNDVNMRSKILILYLLCVFLPIIGINSFFYMRISENLYQQEINNVETSLERISSNILKYIYDIVTVSHILYVDRSLYEGIDRRYDTFLDFFIEYERHMSFTLNKYLPVFPHIEQIRIYTNNETIGNTGVFSLLSEVDRNGRWYQLLHERHNRIVLYPRFVPDHFAPNTTKRTLSIMRKLDYFPAHFFTVDKILRIDMRFDVFNDILADERLYGDIFILNERNEVIFSSNSLYMSNTEGEFYSYSDLESIAGHRIVQRFDRFIRGWRVMTILPEGAFFAILREGRQFIIYLTLLTLLFSTFVIWALSKSLTSRLSMLTTHIGNLNDDNLSAVKCLEGKDEIGILIKTFNVLVNKMKLLIITVYQSDIQKKNLQIERKQAQVNALQSQINPHFLFNALETVRMRSLLKNEHETAEIIKSMSKTFRQLIHWKSDLIPIEEELGFVEDYLKIQKYRFGDKLEYSIEVDDSLYKTNIPKMTIQPFVENSCVHSIEKSKHKGLIYISVMLYNGYIEIKIKDNGKGMDPDTLKLLLQSLDDDEYSGKSIGVKNVYTRLKLFFKDEFLFKIETEIDQGTSVTIRLPKGG